jgi:EAL domain-containing protein (putative c-di-GMP-specific phosphodiesterase class I)
MGDGDLLAAIERELARQPVPAGSLVLEVTETAAVADMDEAQRFAARLSELGCSFALDDFGAGFGSFYYAKHLPFDYLKIDGEFVRNCRSSRVDQVVIDSVVELARGLGKRTVAEFVQDEESAQFLRESGVDFGQGYHLGRPRPVEQVLPAPG